MYLIAGLGNPGREYEHTRHNCGFDALDLVADKLSCGVTKRGHKALLGKGIANGQPVLLAKPQTFMNNSGQCLSELVGYFNIDTASELIVMYDDIALPAGTIRIRKSGSAGGHNGMKSIIGYLSTQDFIRIRIGVGGKPEKRDLVDHVLGHFPPDERRIMDEALEQAAQAALLIIEEGPDKAMNRYNRKKTETKDPEQ